MKVRQNISTRGTLSKNFGAINRINEEKLPKNYELEQMRLISLAEEVKLKGDAISQRHLLGEKLTVSLQLRPPRDSWSDSSDFVTRVGPAATALCRSILDRHLSCEY